jgi:hypothetical protein
MDEFKVVWDDNIIDLFINSVIRKSYNYEKNTI